MTEHGGGDERLHDLLIKRALWGIDTGESRELAALSQQYPEVELDMIDRTVASLDTVELGPTPPLPDTISNFVLGELRRDAGPANMPFANSMPAEPVTVPVVPWLAAAACAVLAVMGWWRPWAVSPANAPTSAMAPTAATPSSALDVNGEPVAFSALGDAAGDTFTGHIIWDGTAQRGVMELAGLPTNDPTAEQYQLWIIDAAREDPYPVDGGVFDVSIAGTTRVPVRPPIAVGRARQFVITLEPPGGVVVSAQDRLVAAATMP